MVFSADGGPGLTGADRGGQTARKGRVRIENWGGTKHSIIAPSVPPLPPLFRTHLTDEGCCALARTFVEPTVGGRLSVSASSRTARSEPSRRMVAILSVCRGHHFHDWSNGTRGNCWTSMGGSGEAIDL